MRNQGDVDVEFAKGDKTIAAEYYAPHLAHVSMEPPVAVADVRDGKAVIWTSTQNPQAVQEVVAGQLGIPQSDVTCHVALLGGGSGESRSPITLRKRQFFRKRLGGQ